MENIDDNDVGVDHEKFKEKEVDRERLKETVRKLLALAGNNSSEDEVAAALAKVSVLVAKYNLDEAEIKGKDDNKRIAVKIVSTELKQSWARDIWNSTAKLNFCFYYYNKQAGYPDVHNLIGTEANVTSVKVMGMYLIEAVERLAREAPIKGRERPAFKLGAACRLASRLNALRLERATGKDQPTTTGTTLPALANLYDVHEQANKDHFDEISGGGKIKKGARSSTKNVAAFFQGAEAANGINLSSQINKGQPLKSVE